MERPHYEAAARQGHPSTLTKRAPRDTAEARA